MTRKELIENIARKRSFLCVGLDSDPLKLPTSILDTAVSPAQAMLNFNKAIVDATAPYCVAYKPNTAFYEALGAEGWKVLAQTIEYIRKNHPDQFIIADAKRGDIGNTSALYARAFFENMNVDALTVAPYMGSDSVKPFIKVCKEENKGVFVLVKTSNPSSGEFQDRMIADADNKPLYEIVGEMVAKWGEDHMGDSYSYVGAVVGATYPEMGKILRKLMPKSYILVPGYGAQGGKGADLVHFFNEDGLGAIVNSSRGIIAAYQQEKYASFGPEHFAEASRAAVEDMRKDIMGALENR